MWKVVKKVKRETSGDKQCSIFNPILFEELSDWASQVKAVEQELQIESTEATFQNMTSADLEAAAEMFIYLNMCPDKKDVIPNTAIQQRYQSWFRLYDDLFKNESPDMIILTLNRLLTQTEHKHKIIKRNKVLFKMVASRLNLKYGNIQSLLPYGPKTSMEDYHNTNDFLNTEGRYVLVM